MADEAPSSEAPEREPEPPEHQLKRWEEFYKYAQNAHNRAHERWSAADDKSWKSLTLLGIIVGAGTLGVRPIAEVMSHRTSYLHWAFIVMYGAADVFAIAAFTFFYLSLRIQQFTSQPTRPEMLDFFSEHYYVDVLYSLGRDLMASAELTQLTVEEKFAAAAIGFKLMLAAGGCLILSSALYVGVLVRNGTTDDAKTTSITVINEQQPNGAQPAGTPTDVRPSPKELRGTAASTPKPRPRPK